MKNAETLLILGVAALFAMHLQLRNQSLEKQLEQLKTEYEGFKQGVIYGR